MWKDSLRTFKQIPRGHQNDANRLNWLKSILNVKLNEKEYSDFFKFLTEIVKIHPETLGIIIERIQEEWHSTSNIASALLFKSTVSFLGRLKKSVRRQEFKGKISRLWGVIFNFPAEERLKLHLVREYRRELPFGWLYEFTLKDEFFYIENLNTEVMEAGTTGTMAVFDILMEVMNKTRNFEELKDELRVSGLLEKIGSLWRSPALPKIIKLLAMASSISVNNIFDSLPCFLDAIISYECSIWSIRLVDSILRKYSKRQYVLSNSRTELNSISKQVIKIACKSIEKYSSSEDDDDDSEMNKSICGLIRSVLERWEGMACSNESEVEFCEKVIEFLEISYKNISNNDNNSNYNLLSVFAKNFIDPLVPQIVLFFRNSLKLAAKTTDDDSLSRLLDIFTKILVKDGGTDRAFPLLFKEYPSLIVDVHKILSIKGGGGRHEMNRLSWLLILAESPRTKKVLIDFLVDPEQVNEIESNEFWLAFMGRLADGNNFGNVNKWSKGRLSNQFLCRVEELEDFDCDEYFFELSRQVIDRTIETNKQANERVDTTDNVAVTTTLTTAATTTDIVHTSAITRTTTDITPTSAITPTLALATPPTLPPPLNLAPPIAPTQLIFLLKASKNNIEIFNWLVERIDCKQIILSNLKNLIPFKIEEISKKVYEILKNDLMSMEEILNFLFQSSDKEMLKVAASQWNLLLESDNLNFIKEDYQNNEIEDYGNYLEELFDDISNDNTNNNNVLIKESSDPIEMFLEYYKFGQIKSIKILQADLLSKFKCTELLLRIPLTILMASGPDFGGIILDSLISNGWDDEDIDIIMTSTCKEYNFDLLKMYYTNRLKK